MLLAEVIPGMGPIRDSDALLARVEIMSDFRFRRPFIFDECK